MKPGRINPAPRTRSSPNDSIEMIRPWSIVTVAGYIFLARISTRLPVIVRNMLDDLKPEISELYNLLRLIMTPKPVRHAKFALIDRAIRLNNKTKSKKTFQWNRILSLAPNLI